MTGKAVAILAASLAITLVPVLGMLVMRLEARRYEREVRGAFKFDTVAAREARVRGLR